LPHLPTLKDFQDGNRFETTGGREQLIIPELYSNLLVEEP
jgi:hypothetical protein